MHKNPYGTFFIYSIKQWITSLFLLTLLFSGSKSFAANGFANNSNGNWNNPSTWLFNGTPRTPMCGDTITIPVAYTVTVNSQESYTACIIPMVIVIDGILQFTNGNKLDLPCGSTVYIHAGGLLKKATAGGGNSTFISICGDVEWSAGDGDLQGPAILGGPLPVSLLSFNAFLNNRNTVDIKWTTVSETNNSYFIVQRSLNNLTYYDLAEVEGAGNSNEVLNYTSIDEAPVMGVNYYRLCQVDFDGTRTYYHPVAVRLGKADNILVYPNPSTETLWVEVPNDVQISINDIYGKTISSYLAVKGINNTSVKELATGVYTLKAQNGADTFVRKIIIQK